MIDVAVGMAPDSDTGVVDQDEPFQHLQLVGPKAFMCDCNLYCYAAYRAPLRNRAITHGFETSLHSWVRSTDAFTIGKTDFFSTRFHTFALSRPHCPSPMIRSIYAVIRRNVQFICDSPSTPGDSSRSRT